MSAANRWNFACQAAADCATAPTSHSPTKVSDNGTSGRLPGPMPARSVAPATARVTSTSSEELSLQPPRREKPPAPADRTE